MTIKRIKHLFQAFMVLLLMTGSAQGATAGRILVLGDSLSAAYGIDREDGWVALLRQRLAAAQIDVINASISGETTGGGLTRLAAQLDEHQPDIVILELGANDGLRGMSVLAMKRNLQSMIEQSLGRGARVLLLGMMIPPNYGPTYTQQFEKVYRELGEINGVTLLPFFLDGVATEYDLLQSDGLHPNADAQPILLDNVWPLLERLLELAEPK